jgi:hypothetical protein
MLFKSDCDKISVEGVKTLLKNKFNKLKYLGLGNKLIM